MNDISMRRVFERAVQRGVLRRNLSVVQRKAVSGILRCRTGDLGWSEKRCACGHREAVALSCRNRHCPRCQAHATAQWVANQSGHLLPTRYFHVVFTLPPALHPLFRYNEARLYALFFSVSASVLKDFFRHDRRLGVAPAIVGVLHTWGQQLQYHPHLHFLVTAGGLDAEAKWRQIPAAAKPFLFDVRALSRCFRGRLLGALESLWRRGKLRAPDGWSEEAVPAALRRACDSKWVLYSKPVLCAAEKVLEYLGRYIKRIAISESRLVRLEGDQVTFRYKNHRKGSSWELAVLPLEQFVNRFLQHVLPPGFHKIRYFGIWRERCLEQARRQLGDLHRIAQQRLQALLLACAQWRALPQILCPKCGGELSQLISRDAPKPCPIYSSA